MAEPISHGAAHALAGSPGPSSVSRRAGWGLAVSAAAMELLYVLVLRLGNLKEHVETFLALILLLGILYFVSFWLVEKIASRRSWLIFLFLSAGAFRLTLFPLYPSLSDDSYRYRWEAKAQQAGYNPYLVHPSDPALAHLRDETYPAVSGPQYGTLYGPLLEEVFWVTLIFTSHPVAMKVPFVLLDLGVVLLLFRLLPAMGLSPLRAVIYAWSPLVVVEFAASGHNDSLPIFAFVLALVCWERRRSALSVASVAASALSKVYAAFLLPVFLMRAGWRHIWIPAVLAAAAMAPYREAWSPLLATLSAYPEHWRNNASLYVLIGKFTGSNQQTRGIYLLSIGVAMLYGLARRLHPQRASFLILGTVLLFAPNVFPWYLTWILPLLAIYPNPAWLLLTVSVFLSYHVLIPYRTLGLWREETLYTLVEYVPFYSLLVGGYLMAVVRRRFVGKEERSTDADLTRGA